MQHFREKIRVFSQYTYFFLLRSVKLICHFKRYYWCHCHSSYSSEITDRAFMTLLQQVKHTTTDNPNNIGLTFSPKNQLPQVGRKRIFNISLKIHKTYRKL